MKDIMQKLAELEATAPKVTKKKMLNEDSTTPPMNVSNKIASLKDMFEALSESIPPGQKPLPVLDPQNKQAGMGFVTSNNPAVQNMLKNLDPKDVQIVQAPGQPGQAPAAGQPAQAGATGQPQTGQMQMKEKDEGKPGKNFAKIAKSAGARYGSKEAGERVAGAVRAKLAKQGKLEEESMEESGLQAYLGNKKYGKDGMDALRKAGREHAGKEKMANLRAKYDKMDEGDLPSTAGVDTKGAGLGAGRSQTTLEGKKGVNPFAKKDDKASTKAPAKGKKPDFLDLDKDGNKKEPMKKAAADKNKKKVKESMNHRISAARLEGKSHGLRGHAHSGKRYEDMSEMKAYHEGYKEGLDECYGQGVYETAPAMPAATVGGMADQEMEEGKLGKALTGAAMAATLAGGGMMAKGAYDYHKKDPISHMSQADMDDMSYRITKEDDMEEGNAFTAALAKTPKGGKFAVGGKTFTDRTGYDAKVNEYAFESLDQQLNALLNESEEVNEGLSVSISKGQQNSPDSVTITAQDAEAEHLLAFVKNAGLGLFGDDNADTHSSAMSVQPSHGAPDEIGAGGAEIGVIDGHDGMMGLMQKLSGIQAGGADDYADEEGEEQLYGNHQEADKKDCGCDGDCECSDYDQPSNEETCNECGSMMEAGHSCGSKEVVDEVESEDQMEFEVAEDNAPDSGEAESTADEDAEAKEDAALAGADSGDEEEMNESFASLLERLTKLAEGSGDEPKHSEHDKKDDKDQDDAEEELDESEQLDEISDKLAQNYASKASDEMNRDRAKGIMPTKDRSQGVKLAMQKSGAGQRGVDPSQFGVKVGTTKEEKDLKEWANNAGPGKTVSDTTFEQDIDFMTKVISGGLNKQKSTGQTTIPVIAGQENRMHDNPMDWATLAGIKK
jgi:hypothetical protein